MTFSIIIVSYNTAAYLKKCLNSIFLNCGRDDFEIIIVDNNSTDESPEMLKAYGDKISLIANNRNLGFGAANNQAAKIAKGKIIFFLNSDTEVKGDILTPIQKYFQENAKTAVLSPALIDENSQPQEYAYGKFPNMLNVMNKFRNQESRNEQDVFATDWVSGAALVVRKSLFEKIGGFDEKFFMYFEDIDLCKRIKDLGYEVVVFNKAQVTHFCGKSLNSFGWRKNYYYVSQDYYYLKHFGLMAMQLIKIMRFSYKIMRVVGKRSEIRE